MTEQPDGTAAPKAIASKSGGRGIAVFAFLVAICALTLGAYLGYRLVYLQPFADQTQQVKELVAATERKILAELDSSMTDSRMAISELAESLRQENLDVQKELRQAVAQSLEEAVANKPTTPRQWRLAEAAFLMRFANHWLLLEGDAATALQALQSADQVLLAIQGEGAGDEYDLLPVRLLLAKEILALQLFKPVDVQGIYGQLQALETALPEVRSSLTLSPPTADMEPAAVGWDAVISELAKFVRVTDLSVLEDSDDSVTGSDLGPAQLLTARRQAMAAIERAQVAVLRGQEALFQASLAQAKQAALQLGLATDLQVQTFVDQVDALSEKRLTQPLPTISASLQALDSVLDAS
jgi:uroporphyrin-3 C-methyltransferase